MITAIIKKMITTIKKQPMLAIPYHRCHRHRPSIVDIVLLGGFIYELRIPILLVSQFACPFYRLFHRVKK